MAMQSIEQQRAKAALAWAESQGKNVDSETVSAAVGMPAMILMNGLGQTAAFYKSKDKAHYTNLYNELSKWLIQKGKPYAGKENMLKGITEGDAKTYRAAQVEALAYLQWVKKFAKAYAKESDHAATL
ncbi:MAG: type III-B CRISPR module-associated protein Cmr5 [Gallionella sp.]